MDKQTPTQIARKIIIGCKMEIRSYYKYKWYSKKYNTLICGNIPTTFLCDNCKSKILAYRTAWENELEDRKELCFDNIDCSCCQSSSVFNESRISELTSALKILDGEHTK